MSNNSNKIYVGMDLHKKTSSFCVMKHLGEVLLEQTIQTTPEEVKAFIKKIQKLKDTKGKEIHLVLEPVSQSCFYIEFIQKLNVKVHLAHPLKVKAISSAKAKTDKIDAKILADLLRANLLPEAYCSPLEVREWKEISRTRSSLVKQRTQIKNKIHAILFRNAIIYPKGSLFTKKGIEWLQNLELDQYYKFEINLYLETLNSLDKQIQKAEEKIKEKVKETKEMELLKTIPGISDITAITIMSEIGDIKRFESAKQLHSYAGLVPSIYSSGGKTKTGKISKQGSKYLRYALIEVAHHQLRLKKQIGLKWFYQRTSETKGNKTAAVATARKLLTVIYQILKEQRPYEERVPQFIS